MIIAKVKPYNIVSLDFLSQQLKLSREDICGLLSELILEEKIKGEIDQLNGFLEITKSSVGGGATVTRHGEMRKWAHSLNTMHGQLMKKFQAGVGGGLISLGDH